MKILLIIDHFGSGGAQRQIVELARGLIERRHTAEMFVYFPRFDFFRGELALHNVRVHEYAKEHIGSRKVIMNLARVLRAGRFDVAISFQGTANIYAELGRLGARSTRLIVSERTNFRDDRSALGAVTRRLLHLLADRVVANSETQAAWLKGRPWLEGRVSCIYNGVDLNRFRPAAPPRTGSKARILGIGRIGPEKNLRNLMLGLQFFADKVGSIPQIHWAGERDMSPAGQQCCRELDALLAQLQAVNGQWRWLGLQSDISALLPQYDALVHPSLYEGSPNAVCEALACGVPVLASNVCDHPRLVRDGERGFLFDPTSPAGISDALRRLLALTAEERSSFSRNARQYAETYLGTDTMVEAYERLCARLSRGSAGAE